MQVIQLLNVKTKTNIVKIPYIVYATLKSSFVKSNEPGVVHTHNANAATFYVVCNYDPSHHRLKSYVGEDCADLTGYLM